MSNDKKRYKVGGSGIIHEVVDGEVIIIDIDTGAYYSLEGAGGRIWEDLSASATVGETVSDLLAHFDATAEEAEDAVHKLVLNLMENGLLVEADSNGTPRAAKNPPMATSGDKRPRLGSCELNKYTDMAEMLAIDPIHQVEETGWPNRN